MSTSFFGAPHFARRLCRRMSERLRRQSSSSKTWHYVREVAPHATLFGIGFGTIQVLRLADLSVFTGSLKQHEDRKYAVQIQAYLRHTIGEDPQACALLCELALWYSLISPTSRLDNLLFCLLDEKNLHLMSKLPSRTQSGLRKLYTLVKDIRNKIPHSKRFSESDIMNMIACTALELIGGPRIKSQIGRRDLEKKVASDTYVTELHHKIAKEGLSSLEQWFGPDLATQRHKYHQLTQGSQFSLDRSHRIAPIRRVTSDDFAVALYGGLRCLNASSNAEQITNFSNESFQSILLRQFKEAHNPHMNEAGKIKSSTLIQSLLLLFKIHKRQENGEKTFEKVLICDKITLDRLQHFATDEAAFFETFARIFTWLLERGYAGDKLYDIHYQD